MGPAIYIAYICILLRLFSLFVPLVSCQVFVEILITPLETTEHADSFQCLTIYVSMNSFYRCWAVLGDNKEGSLPYCDVFDTNDDENCQKKNIGDKTRTTL